VPRPAVAATHVMRKTTTIRWMWMRRLGSTRES
jgi:hypothetical protein